VVVVVGAV